MSRCGASPLSLRTRISRTFRIGRSRRAEFALRDVLGHSAFSGYLRNSFALGNTLLPSIRSITRKERPADRLVDGFDLHVVRNNCERYSIALTAELDVSPSLFVTRKGGYDTLSLLDQGYVLFPADLWAKVPEAMFDTSEACKALAFDLPTSCGPHVFRATEAVLRKDYDVPGGAAAPKAR